MTADGSHLLCGSGFTGNNPPIHPVCHKIRHQTHGIKSRTLIRLDGRVEKTYIRAGSLTWLHPSTGASRFRRGYVKLQKRAEVPAGLVKQAGKHNRRQLRLRFSRIESANVSPASPVGPVRRRHTGRITALLRLGGEGRKARKQDSDGGILLPGAFKSETQNRSYARRNCSGRFPDAGSTPAASTILECNVVQGSAKPANHSGFSCIRPLAYRMFFCLSLRLFGILLFCYDQWWPHFCLLPIHLRASVNQ